MFFKLKIFIFLHAIFIISVTTTIAQNWLWSDAVSSTNDIAPKGMAIDINENIYILGQFEGTTTIGAQIITSANNSTDLFVAKIDNTGTLSWVKQAGGNQSDTPKAIAVDNSGNVYITGAFKDTAGFGTNPADTIFGDTDSNEDVFLAKYSTSGSLDWVINAGTGTGKDRGAGIVVDQSGDIVIIGFFNDSLKFGGFAIPDTFNQNSNFIAKYNNTGGLIWAQAYESANKKTRFNQISLCESGGVNLGYYIGGYYYTDITIGTDYLTSAGEGDAMIFRINNDGIVQWVRDGGGTGDDQCYSSTAAPNGDVYMTGYIHGLANFGTESISAIGGADLFIAKYDINGNIQWATGHGGSGDDLGSGIFAVNSNIYLTGYFSGTTVWNNDILWSGSTVNFDPYISAFSDDGEVLWAKSIQGELEDRGVNIVADNTDNIYVSGFFNSDSIIIGSDIIKNGGVLQNLFFAKYGCNDINITTETYTDITCNNVDDGTITVAATGDGTLTYLISDSLQGINLESATGNFTDLSEGDYTIDVEDINGCTLTGSTISIIDPEAIEITEVNTSNESAPNVGDGEITVYSTGGIGQLTYEISPDTSMILEVPLEDTINTTGVFANLVAGDYIITVYDLNDCFKTVSAKVFLTTTDNLEIFDAFTPNGDDKNQVWNIENIELYPNCNVKIFNSWGNLIFSSVGYTEPWDGTYKGSQLPTASYYYIIDLGDGSRLLTGSVALIK